MNEGNLIFFTRENAQEQGKKGGLKSGESKRQKKQLREYLSELLELKAGDFSNTDKVNYKTDRTNGAAVAVAILKKAKAGDLRAARLICEIMGELRNTIDLTTVDKTDIEAAYMQAQQDIFKHMTDAELRALVERLRKGEEVPEDEKPLLLPNGEFIVGAAELED